MHQTFLVRFFRGARAQILGLRYGIVNRQVQKAYLWIVLVLFFVSLLLNTVGIGVLFHFLPVSSEQATWTLVGAWLLRVFGMLLLLVLSPFLALSLCNLLLPVFAEIPLIAGLHAMGSPLAAQLEASEGLSLKTSILISLRRLSWGLAIGASAFALGFIPVAGTFIALAVQLFWGSRIIGWEMLDPYFDKSRADYAAQKAAVARFRPEIMGMGTVAMSVLAIPLFGPLFFGLVQSAVAQFVVEIVEPGELEEELSRTLDGPH